MGRIATFIYINWKLYYNLSRWDGRIYDLEKSSKLYIYREEKNCLKSFVNSFIMCQNTQNGIMVKNIEWGQLLNVDF